MTQEVLHRGNRILGRCAMPCVVAIGMVPSWVGAASTPNVTVDCPAMAAELRASVEARARAELAMNRVTGGEINVHCWLPLVVVESTTPVRSSSRHLVGNPDQWVDEILSMVHELLTPEVQPATLPSLAPQPIAEAPKNPPAFVPPLPAPQQFAAPVAVASPPRPDLSHHVQLTPQIGIGLCAELWFKPEVLPGPCAWFGIRHASWSQVAVGGGVQWAASRLNDIAIRHWHAGIEWRLGRTVWIAVGTQVSVYQLTPPQNLSPNYYPVRPRTNAARRHFNPYLTPTLTAKHWHPDPTESRCLHRSPPQCPRRIYPAATRFDRERRV